IFLSMEDETGIANVIVTPDLYERQRLVVTRSKIILAEGPLQNQDGVIHVKASRLLPLSDQTLEIRSHDFHKKKKAYHQVQPKRIRRNKPLNCYSSAGLLHFP